MRATFEEPGVEETRHVGRGDRPVGHAPAGGVDFDHRLEPVEAAGPVAVEVRGQSARFCLGGDGPRDVVCANRAGAGIARDPGAHGQTSASSCGARSGVTRP